VRVQGFSRVLRNPEFRNLCHRWLMEDGKNSAINILIALVVVTINLILQTFTAMMAEWQRPTSMSELNASILYRLFIAQFINTAVVTSLINTEIWPFMGPYSDFERGWYAIVGVPIMTTLFFNIVSGSSGSLCYWFWFIFQRRLCGRRQKHQAEVISFYTNPPFDIAERYARALVTVFVTLTYSSGLPLVILFAIVHFLVTYWVDKLILLRGSRRPPAFDARMPLQASTILLYAGPLHLLVATWMYSHGCTFPSDEILGLGSFSFPSHLVSNFANRLFRKSSWMLFASLVVLLCLWALWLVFQIIGATLGEFFRLLYLGFYKRRPSMLPRGGLERWKARKFRDDGEEGLTWNIAAELISRTQPQISYKFENDPEFRMLLNNTAQKRRMYASRRSSAILVEGDDKEKLRGLSNVEDPPSSEMVCKRPMAGACEELGVGCEGAHSAVQFDIATLEPEFSFGEFRQRLQTDLEAVGAVPASVASDDLIESPTGTLSPRVSLGGVFLDGLDLSRFATV